MHAATPKWPSRRHRARGIIHSEERSVSSTEFRQCRQPYEGVKAQVLSMVRAYGKFANRETVPRDYGLSIG